MTDRDAALRLDTALDDLLTGDRSADPLAVVAATLQELDLRQQAAPSDAFRTHLRQSLFASPNGVHHLSPSDEPVALTPPRPAPHRTAQPNKSHRFLAFAAALLLLLGGAGAVTRLPIGNRRDPEPSAIPAAAFASPAGEDASASSPIAESPNDLPGPQTPMALAGGTLYRIEHGPNDAMFSGLRAYLASDGTRRWQVEGASFGPYLAADDRTMFATQMPSGATGGQIMAYDASTGEVVWTIAADGEVTGLTEADGTLYAVSTMGSVSAIDQRTGDVIWTTEASAGIDHTPNMWGTDTIDVSSGYVVALTPAGTIAVLHVDDGEIAWTKDGHDPAFTTFVATDNGVVVFERESFSMVPATPGPEVGVLIPVESDALTSSAGGAGADAVDNEAVSTSWGYIKYELGFGSFMGSSWGGLDLTAQPVAIGNIVAIPVNGYAGGPEGGPARYVLSGISTSSSGTVDVELPAQIEGQRITQLGTWAPSGGAPEQFVVVTDTGMLALIAPRRLGPVDEPAGTVDDYDGSVVDLTQGATNSAVTSQPIGDVFGIYLTMANSTLTHISLERLNRTLQQTPVATPKSAPGDMSGADWIVLPPEGASEPAFPSAELVDGTTLYRIFRVDYGPAQVQAVDIDGGTVLWERPAGLDYTVLAASADSLLVAGSEGSNPDVATHTILALDKTTGEARWEITVPQLPVGLLVTDDTFLVLGKHGLLEAYRLSTPELIWEVDLEPYTADSAIARSTYRLNSGATLAAADGLIAAVLQTGQLVAVDAETGDVEWASEQAKAGWSRVVVMEGRFIVITDIDRGPGSSEPTTSDATPLLEPDSVADGCQLAYQSDSSNADSTGGHVESFDPRTGSVHWSYRATNGSWINQLSATTLIASADLDVGEETNWVSCSIEVDTGTMTRFSGNAPNTPPMFLLPDPEGGDTYSGFVVTADGNTLEVDLPTDAATTAPFLDFDPAESGGGFRAMVVDGAILISTGDGTLLGFRTQKSASGMPGPVATPAISTPETGIAWAVDAPEGAGEQWTPLHAVSDGHIYRMVGMKLGWSHLQAIDMSAGAVVWDIPLAISVSAMQPYDDLLVIAGQDGESLGFDYPLVALDPRTGEEVWRTTLSQLPVGMVIRGDTAFLLGADNYLDAIDLTTQETIFASDLRGESQPFDAIPDHAHTRVNRLVMVSNTLVAVLADGSLVGVDPHTGVGTWWRLTDVPRRVEVYEIDGSLVTVDQGSWAHIQGEEASVAATPVPLEETSSSSCLAVVGSIGPDGSAAGVPEASWWQSFAGVDAETGDTVWRSGRIGANYRELTDTKGMILIANVPPADVPESRADMVVCHLDAQRGAVTQIDDLSELIDETFILTDPQDPGSALGFGVLENGGYLALPVELVPEWTGPIIDLTFDPAYPGVAWIEVVDGDSYLALNDGRLVKLIGET